MKSSVCKPHLLLLTWSNSSKMNVFFTGSRANHEYDIHLNNICCHSDSLLNLSSLALSSPDLSAILFCAYFLSIEF